MVTECYMPGTMLSFTYINSCHFHKYPVRWRILSSCNRWEECGSDVKLINVAQLGGHRAETWSLVSLTSRPLPYTIWIQQERKGTCKFDRRITSAPCSQRDLPKQPWEWEISNQSILLQPPVVQSRRGKKNARDGFETPAESHHHHSFPCQSQGSRSKGWS